MKINWNNKYATIAMYAFLVICGSILLYLGISHITLIKSSVNDFVGTLQPFIIGGALSYLLNFILRFYEDKILSNDFFKKLKKSYKRSVGLLLTYITASIITYLFIQFVLPQLVDSIVGLVN
ncbi:MAG: AI-2E family transporter, partial [Clostridium celatum]|nr:AI-2E family transporter [Clostridium celatum]